MRVIKRNGTVVPFEASKISVAITKAFLAVEGGTAAASSRIHETVAKLTELVAATFQRRMPSGGTIHIEDVQDQVELSLMRAGEHKIARDYVIYREEQARKRAAKAALSPATQAAAGNQRGAGRRQPRAAGPRSPAHHRQRGLYRPDRCQRDRHPRRGPEEPLRRRHRRGAEHLTGDHRPHHDRAGAQLLLRRRPPAVRQPARRGPELPGRGHQRHPARHGHLYAKALPAYVAKGIELELLAPNLQDYDLEQLGQALLPERDLQFTYLGLQTLYDRYFIHSDDVRIELPQIFFMRVAMGLAAEEDDKNARAIEFYQLLSSFDYMSSTPTLFNAGTLRPQLSSCYLTTVPDDLHGIYGAIQDNAMLSKFAGGLGNDWTPVRALGAYIKGTNGKSQGVVPFLKVVNDTAVAVNQGGKRKGAVCAYLETWHLDIEEFVELRKNTGDDRRRTHDMNTANWIPDLFMKRVFDGGDWTLFSPNDAPDLHDLYGKAFEERYQQYEEMTRNGELKLFKTIKAENLWRKMLGMLFETGHPWMTFKDPCNLRSPQQHVGVVHSSNLCTEITLNTNKDEIAVCNLGSVNLPQHIDENGLNLEKLQKTVRTAVRMLDNVIDINYYSVPQARTPTCCTARWAWA